MVLSNRRILALKVVVWIVCLLPFLRLALFALTNRLGANPIEFITRDTGFWALTGLMATLSITPLRRYAGQPWLIRFRRLLGLFAFFYASLHFLTWFVFDHSFDFGEMAKDVAKRPFITVGMATFLMLLPLTITSTNGWIRRMGGKRWQVLHRLIYFAAATGVVHFYWLVKKDVTLPVRFAVVLAVLFTARFMVWFQGRRPASTAAEATAD